MKNVIVAGVVALGLIGCGAKEEVAAPEAAPAVEATPAPEAEAAPAVEAAPAEAAPEGVDGGKAATP
jgi:hypothetical protein